MSTGQRRKRVNPLIDGLIKSGEEKEAAKQDSGSEKGSSPRQESRRQGKGEHVGFAAAVGGETQGERSRQSYVVMEKQIKELSEKADSYIRTMPVTKLEVRMRREYVDPGLIDVSPENQRQQDLLNRQAVSDIYPDIEANEQQEAGLLRPKAGGRFELIAGSRRLWCVTDLGRDYLAEIGDIPDADVRALSRVENAQKEISAYEKAVSYLRDIQSGRVKDWAHLAIMEGLSKPAVSRYKALAEMSPVILRAFSQANDMTTTQGVAIKKLLAESEHAAKAILDEAASLVEEKAQCLKEGGELPDGRAVFKRLKSAGEAAVAKSAVTPTKNKPVIYRSKDGMITLKHKLSRDGDKVSLDVEGADEEVLARLVQEAARLLGVEISSGDAGS